MPFDLFQLMPAIEKMADYYAGVIAPDQERFADQAWELAQQVGREALLRAAQRHTVRVLALPWEDADQVYPEPPSPPPYRVLASDGSAIDPDPHFPVRYAVVHIGLAGLAYNPPNYWSEHQPQIFFRREELEFVPEGGREAVSLSGPVIDTLRAYEEVAFLWDGAARRPPDEHDRPLLAMTDAILLWTHRGTGPGHEALRDSYMIRSLDLLAKFQQAGLPLVSFLSMPRHREVVHTLLAHFCPADRRLDCNECTKATEVCPILRGLEDRYLFQALPEGARSALFRPVFRGEPRWRLPKQAWDRDPRLAFFYLNTGPEIARVELPLWIVEAGLLDLVQGVILDQCRPLRAELPGYPVALSMAHQEAILTTRDRRAVQWMIEEALARRQIYPAPSTKAQMKGA